MTDLIRDSAFGQLIRFITAEKYLPYPENAPGFILPESFNPDSIVATQFEAMGQTSNRESEQNGSQYIDVEALETLHHQASISNWYPNLGHAISRATLESREINTTHTKDGKLLVTWYSKDDPENPQNWSSGKKFWVSFLICFYSFVVYFGSSVYSPGTEQIVDQFGVSTMVATLGLALYVLAYGIGPMIFSPLSEIPVLGRNTIYIATFFIFTALCIPEALTNSFSGLLVLRFLLGFFGSPCLATGAATFQDMYSMMHIPYLLAVWAGAVTLGPAVAPIVAGFSVSHKDWHWMAWEMLWLAAPVCIAMFLTLPETSADNILLRRAQRLRKLTGRTDIFSQSEIDQVHMTAKQITFNALIKPWEINILDPAVLFSTVYVALVYGIFYSFLECFPLVYPPIYGFNLGESNLPFLTVVVALIFGMSTYMIYWGKVAAPRVAKNGFGPPEDRLYYALFTAWFVPIGLFLFAWTTKAEVHWIVSCVGLTLTMWGEYTIMQCVFLYLPFTYPQYAASLFAANDFARSAFAAGCVIFSQPMYHNLGVPKGVTLLAGLTVGCTIALYFLYFFGANLRARSKFASK